MIPSQHAPAEPGPGDICPFAAATPESRAASLALGQALKQRAYTFTTVTPATHQRVNARAAAGWAKDLAGIFGWNRPFSADLPGDELLASMIAAGVVREMNGSLRSRVRASTLNGQLYLHSGFPTTAADAVFFGPDTYRFIHALRNLLSACGAIGRAADIGCGAGSGAVTIALAHPGAAVFAVDINQAALEATALNARLASAANVIPVQSDLLTAVEGSFDLIVSNPPYLLDRQQRAYRHGGGDLGAGLAVAIVQQAIVRLRPGGCLMLYTGVAIVDNADPFRATVAPLLEAAGFNWTYTETDPDVFGEELDEAHYALADRIAVVCLCAFKPENAASGPVQE